MSQTENSNQVSLPVAGEHGSFLYMSLTENSNQPFLPWGCNRTQNLRFGPYTISHGCLAITRLWKLDYLYILYSSVAMQQGVHLIHAFLKYRIYLII